MEITTKNKVKLPSVPNFILLEDGSGSVDIGTISPEDLDELLAQWCARVRQHALQRRVSK